MPDVQDHLHLSPELETSGEFAPSYKWTASDREEAVVFTARVRRSLTGRPFAHVVRRGGVVVVHYDFSYVVKIEGDGALTTRQYADRLKSMAGRHLYLVDHVHPDDGEDHSAYVKPVLLAEIGRFKADHTMLSYFYVPIYLIDLTIPESS